MKTFTKITAFMLSLVVFMQNVTAASELRWYFKPTKDGTQPETPSEFAFIEDFGGVFIDRLHNESNPDKVIYLTFDVGYENGNVAKILDIMKNHGATGTFFILENVVKSNTELVSRMFNEGHTVANHTMSHKNMANADKAALEAEIYGLEKLCETYVGKKPAKLYRPPEGCFSRENLVALHEMGYSTVFWSSAYADWDNQKQPSPEAAMEKLTSRLHNGEILLLHPTSATNAAIMDEFLTYLEKEGYRFGSISELCGK